VILFILFLLFRQPGFAIRAIIRESSVASEISLREVTSGDLDVFFEHQLDPEANRMAAFTSGDPSNREAFMAHWRKIMAEPTVTNRTVLVDGEVAGSVASYVDAEFGKREVTYWIGKEFWGRGVATAALGLLLSEVVTERPIYGRAAKDNTGSIRVLEKCGFRLTGYDRGYAAARGEEIEEVIMELSGE
jgi:RimJ/RimL family protein N-acetyltransferase